MNNNELSKLFIEKKSTHIVSSKLLGSENLKTDIIKNVSKWLINYAIRFLTLIKINLKTLDY